MKNIFTLGFLLATIIFSAQEKPVKPSDLPAPATSFLQQYFKNIAIHHVVKDSDDKKITFEVMLANSTEIEFTETGNWKEVDGKKSPIPTGFVPKEILDYIKSNYPKEKITHIDKGIKDIDVDLTNNLELKFDLSGKFIRIDK